MILTPIDLLMNLLNYDQREKAFSKIIFFQVNVLLFRYDKHEKLKQDSLDKGQKFHGLTKNVFTYFNNLNSNVLYFHNLISCKGSKEL